MSTVGIRPGEADPRVVYAEIIDLPHHVSRSRPHMSLYNRAAQFAPFAALSGYEEMIREEKRETGSRIELDEVEKEALDRKLGVIAAAIEAGERPVLTITYFRPDLFKLGGAYVTVTEKIRKIDRINRQLVLERAAGRAGTLARINISEIIAISGEVVDRLDDDFL